MATTTTNEELISLLVAKELEISEMRLYINQLESSYNDLVIKYNKLNEKFYSRDKKRNQIGFKRNGG